VIPLETSPVNKALWFIENHSAEDIHLDDVAEVAGVSKFHISRVFGLATGYSVMQYVRGRRLTEAARALSRGAASILDVALAAGYGSHEAFTRAFRDQFGCTPETVRTARTLHNIPLMEPITMEKPPLTNIELPRFVDGQTMLIAGLNERCGDNMNAPAQWQRFVPYLGHIPGQSAPETYGVLHNSDGAGSMEYLCGVEVSDFSRIPAELSGLRIPAQKYAVFFHSGHVSTIRQTWHAIYSQWLPSSGYKAAGGPEFERYPSSFHPITGSGGVEIWIPVMQ
jgi:AraC family transcriptional regulator